MATIASVDFAMHGVCFAGFVFDSRIYLYRRIRRWRSRPSIAKNPRMKRALCMHVSGSGWSCVFAIISQLTFPVRRNDRVKIYEVKEKKKEREHFPRIVFIISFITRHSAACLNIPSSVISCRRLIGKNRCRFPRATKHTVLVIWARFFKPYWIIKQYEY